MKKFTKEENLISLKDAKVQNFKVLNFEQKVVIDGIEYDTA